MGFLQFLRNGIDKTSDVINGRFVPFDEVLRIIVNGAKFRTQDFANMNAIYCSATPDEIKRFLLCQVVLFCEAKSILRIPSAYEYYNEYRGDTDIRADKVFQAMRVEFDKCKKNNDIMPLCHFAFHKALVNINAMPYDLKCERKYIGFNVMEEYSSVLSSIANCNHDGIVAFFKSYIPVIERKAFECFDALAHLSPSQRTSRKSAYDKETVYDNWVKLINDTFLFYKREICSARLTDISKDFAGLY